MYTKQYSLGVFIVTAYYKDSKCKILHREDGPAIIYVDKNDNLICYLSFYYINNIRCSEMEYWQEIEKMKRFGGFI